MTEEQESWKVRLEQLGISQADFSRMINIRKADLCFYVNCKRDPVGTTFTKIAEAIESLEESK